ncbi:ell-associated factor Eaf-like, partial [Physella acuta]|uniref:ell-associated factor Eaf-like n=1 Tax=Physella acuta TaxID=109671 RepID=UPI0027DC1439
MDVLTDDPTLHGVLGRELGLDNAGYDLPAELEDILKSEGMCLQDEALTLAALGHGSPYNHGSNGSCSLSHLSYSGQGQGQGHLTHDPSNQRHHLNLLADQLKHQQQHYQYSIHQQNLPQNSSCEHQHQTQHHQQQTQHHQQQQQISSSYCSTSGQPPHLPYDVYDHPPSVHT